MRRPCACQNAAMCLAITVSRNGWQNQTAVPTAETSCPPNNSMSFATRLLFSYRAENCLARENPIPQAGHPWTGAHPPTTMGNSAAECAHAMEAVAAVPPRACVGSLIQHCQAGTSRIRVATDLILPAPNEDISWAQVLHRRQQPVRQRDDPTKRIPCLALETLPLVPCLTRCQFLFATLWWIQRYALAGFHKPTFCHTSGMGEHQTWQTLKWHNRMILVPATILKVPLPDNHLVCANLSPTLLIGWRLNSSFIDCICTRTGRRLLRTICGAS